MLYAMRSSTKDKMKKLELKGKKFGYVKIIKFSHIDNLGHTVWLGKCICGVIKTFRGSHLTKGFSTSCGCKQRLKGLDHPLSTGYGEIPGHRWAQIKRSAKVRNITFSLTIKQAWKLFLKQNRRCALSGVLLEFGEAGLKRRNMCKILTASLDRVDSNKGYIKGNVQWLHKKVNLMKHTNTEKEFLDWCKIITKHQEDYEKSVA